jgi:hypothetical protein
MNASSGWLLEVLDQSGRVQSRVPIEPGRLTLGRSPDNDVVLDDPYVDPCHAVLHVDAEGVRLRDLDSLNGAWLDGRRRIREAPLEAGQSVQLGHSRVRLHSLSATVPPAWRDATSHGWAAQFRRPLVLVFSLLLAVAGLAFDAWLEETRRLSAGILANQLAYPLLGLLLWAGLWSGINHVTSHRAYFSAHLAIGASALALLFFGEHAVLVIAFAFDHHAAAPWMLLAVEILVVGGALFAHLQYVVHGRRGLQAVGAVLVAAILFGSPALGDWLRRDDFSSHPFLNPLLLPPAVQQVEGQSVQGFLDEATPLRDSVEASR